MPTNSLWLARLPISPLSGHSFIGTQLHLRCKGRSETSLRAGHARLPLWTTRFLAPPWGCTQGITPCGMPWLTWHHRPVCSAAPVLGSLVRTWSPRTSSSPPSPTYLRPSTSLSSTRCSLRAQRKRRLQRGRRRRFVPRKRVSFTARNARSGAGTYGQWSPRQPGHGASRDSVSSGGWPGSVRAENR